MKQTTSQRSSYLIAALLGAIGGGILVIVATKAIPNMMANTMRGMMAQMKTCGCNPGEM